MDNKLKDINLNGDVPSIGLLENISAEFSMIEGSCYYSHININNTTLDNFESRHFKVTGNVLVLLVKGHLKIELDTDNIEVEGPATVSLSHGAIVSMHNDEKSDIEAHILIYSPSFLHNINISFSTISVDALIKHDSPIMSLGERELHIMLRYISLIHKVMTDTTNQQLNANIISSLTTALFYQMMLFIYRRIDNHSNTKNGPRRNTYVQDFLKLVHLYFASERSVSFYASQLYISPKYLSLLVKEATGRSAAAWIDNFVIKEAKNMLLYSGKNVQQVAYALNFSNQSSFGKYFKHLTGLSPTDFQKQR